MYAFFATLEFIAFNTAVIICCGRLTEAILYPIAVNIVMPLAITYGGELAFTNSFGIYYGTTDVIQSPFYNMWPLAFLLNIQNYMAAILYAGIFSVVYFVLAYIGYRKRRAENIGKPFVFKHSYLVTTVVIGISFIITYLYLTDFNLPRSENTIKPGTLIAIAVILLIMMLVMELINYKKIHSMPKFAIHYTGTLGGGILLCFLLVWSKGFGLGFIVPNSSGIATASLSAAYYGEGWDSHISNSITVRSSEAIDIIREEHQYIIDNADFDTNPYNFAYSEDPYNITSIVYTMKDESRISRAYSSLASGTDMWEKLYQSEEYRISYLEDYKEWRYVAERPVAVRLSNRHSKQVYLTFLEENFLESELLKAIEADLKADTQYGRHSENTIGVLELGYSPKDENGVYAVPAGSDDDFFVSLQIPIYESYTNTLAVLSGHGTIPTAAQATEDSTKNCEIFMLSRVPTGGINMAAEDVRASEDKNSAIFITAEEFKELTSKQVSYNIFDGEDTSDDYEYYLIRGVWDFLDQSTCKELITQTLEKDGLGLESYDILDDYTGKFYQTYHINNKINTEYNAYCDALFEKRTVLKVISNEDSVKGYDVIAEE